MVYNTIMDTLLFYFSVLSSGVYADWGQLLLRVGVGVIFIVHGWPKIKNPSKFAGWLGTVKVWPSMFWALVVAVVEFFGGIALVAGFWVPIVALLMAINMVVAIVLVKRKFVGGWEFDFILLLTALALVLL